MRWLIRCRNEGDLETTNDNLMPGQVHHSVSTASLNCFHKHLEGWTEDMSNTHISNQTMKNNLHETGLYSRGPTIPSSSCLSFATESGDAEEIEFTVLWCGTKYEPSDQESMVQGRLHVDCYRVYVFVDFVFVQIVSLIASFILVSYWFW